MFIVRPIATDRRGSVIVQINDRFYRYDTDHAFIIKFKQLLRFNKGRALAYLKAKTPKAAVTRLQLKETAS